MFLFLLTSIFNLARKCGWCVFIRVLRFVKGVGVVLVDMDDGSDGFWCVLCPACGCCGNSSPLSSSCKSGSDKSSSWWDWNREKRTKLLKFCSLLTQYIWYISTLISIFIYSFIYLFRLESIVSTLHSFYPFIIFSIYLPRKSLFLFPLLKTLNFLLTT